MENITVIINYKSFKRLILVIIIYYNCRKIIIVIHYNRFLTPKLGCGMVGCVSKKVISNNLLDNCEFLICDIIFSLPIDFKLYDLTITVSYAEQTKQVRSEKQHFFVPWKNPMVDDCVFSTENPIYSCDVFEPMSYLDIEPNLLIEFRMVTPGNQSTTPSGI